VKRIPLLDLRRLPAIVESVLFVAEAPVGVASLAKALRRSKEEIEAALADLEEQFEERGIRLQRANGLVRLVSAPEAGPYVERFLGIESKQRLSTAALESLAIIAYKQPVTRAGIEAVRGVSCDSPVASLIARGLIEEVGRASGPGRPALLGTTMKFLEHFGLKSPADLPPLPASAEADGSP
jgi:segregation and condensation protein B